MGSLKEWTRKGEEYLEVKERKEEREGRGREMRGEKGGEKEGERKRSGSSRKDAEKDI